MINLVKTKGYFVQNKKREEEKALLYITLQLIAINLYAYTMCVHKKNPQRFKVLSFFHQLNVGRFIIFLYLDTLRLLFPSLSLFFFLSLSSTGKLTYVFVCCSFLDEVDRARALERERKKENESAVCLLLCAWFSSVRPRKKRKKNACLS